MRIKVCILLLALAVAAGLARPGLAADPSKKPEDFRGVKWGAQAASVPGLKVVDRDGDIVHYDRTGEKKDLGGIALRHVTYSFYKDQFYHAEIGYDGEGAYASLQKSLEDKYGPPDGVREKTDADGHAYEVAVWNWPGYAFIGNRHDKDSPRGRIFYFYAPLTDASAKAQGIAPAPAASTYTVQKGDTLSGIAARLGTTEAEIRKANPNLTDKSLRAGAAIAVPAGAAKAPASKPLPAASTAADGFIEYTVKEGDVLSKVANSHGVRTKDVIAANPGINPDAVKPGTVLKIPVKKEAAPQ